MVANVVSLESLAHWREYAELCKPRVVGLIVFTAVIGMFLATPNWVPLATLIPATLGIGLAAAIQLQEEGASVVAVSRNPDRAATEAVQNNISLASCDVRDREALDVLMKAHAPVDIIVASATGGKRAMGPFLEMDMDAYKASFDKLWGYANVR